MIHTLKYNCNNIRAKQAKINPTKGGFPLSRNFYVRTDVNFNWLYVRKLK